MKEELKREIAAEAAKIIFANEGNYSSVNADDNGAVSVGKVQWHGNRALLLLKKIAQGAGAEETLGKTLYNEIMTASNWETRTVTAIEKAKLSKILGTPGGKAVQDRQKKTFFHTSRTGQRWGLKTRRALYILLIWRIRAGRGLQSVSGTPQRREPGSRESKT